MKINIMFMGSNQPVAILVEMILAEARQQQVPVMRQAVARDDVVHGGAAGLVHFHKDQMLPLLRTELRCHFF